MRPWCKQNILTIRIYKIYIGISYFPAPDISLFALNRSSVTSNLFNEFLWKWLWLPFVVDYFFLLKVNDWPQLTSSCCFFLCNILPTLHNTELHALQECINCVSLFCGLKWRHYLWTMWCYLHKHMVLQSTPTGKGRQLSNIQGWNIHN